MYNSVWKKIKPAIFEKLFESYIISNEYSYKTLEIKGRISSELAIKKMVEWYLNDKN
jgi:hypothetical protein